MINSPYSVGRARSDQVRGMPRVWVASSAAVLVAPTLVAVCPLLLEGGLGEGGAAVSGSSLPERGAIPALPDGVTVGEVAPLEFRLDLGGLAPWERSFVRWLADLPEPDRALALEALGVCPDCGVVGGHRSLLGGGSREGGGGP